ncbi:MAG: Coenzyme F420 hydrogenase/dehydrogenase, beta subunit C-terminal domain [Clostridium sp.]|jgi:coenzyme F420-reducing hydrogenase beta subunit|uniref:Coenzyme F420 hydrogenase/dehydrogenase, beta subunit C-terminal domain n=1 Tax=Faecalibacterium prausnitzii TaxID=853 RepID=UPI001CBB6332|nr:Coenzyme F420 hydrogenase/dehydrogenase, beta subunit C-terminal domain [Faecalibacterium prausnitzii]
MSVISYAVQSRQKNIRLRSTSGGTFSEIARSFIKTGGCVCAAGYDEQGKVVHKLINTISEIDELCESKYVQSNLNNCFAEVESCLSSSRKVLFVGTPCQVAGVKAYLRNKDEKLYTIDLVCYGVPSPMIYIEWRAEIERVYKKKIAYVHFRDKSFGYAAPNVKIVFKDGSSAEQTFLIKSYMKTFMSGLNVRPSCSECAFKGIDRCSDLTFGDCWHIGVFQKAMDDNLGTTSVYVHSPKGSMLLDMIKNQVNISQIDTQQEIKLDGRKINESVQKNPNSIIFFNDARTLPYDVLVKKWVPDSKKEMLVTIIKRHAKNLPFFKKMIKKVRS